MGPGRTDIVREGGIGQTQDKRVDEEEGRSRYMGYIYIYIYNYIYLYMPLYVPLYVSMVYLRSHRYYMRLASD